MTGDLTTGSEIARQIMDELEKTTSKQIIQSKFLPDDRVYVIDSNTLTFPQEAKFERNRVEYTIPTTTLTGVANGDGTLIWTPDPPLTQPATIGDIAALREEFKRLRLELEMYQLRANEKAMLEKFNNASIGSVLLGKPEEKVYGEPYTIDDFINE